MTDFSIKQDSLRTAFTRNLVVPIIDHRNSRVQNQGSLIFSSFDKNLYMSNGSIWEQAVSMPASGTSEGVADVTALKLDEQTTVPGGAPGAGFGTVWIKDDVPNTLMFTDDAGTDWVLGGAGVDTLATVLVSGNVTSGTNIVITEGDALTSAGQLLLSSTKVAADAVRVQASNAAGGIDVDAGTGGLALDTTGGFSIDSSSTTVASNLSTVGAAGFDLSVGSSAGSLILSGGEAAADAVRVQASNAAGGIDVDAGTGGLALDTTGGFSIDSSSTTVASNLSTVGAAGFDLSVGSSAGSLILSGGEAAADAVRVQASNAAGGVQILPGTAGTIQIGAASATGGNLVTPSITVSSGAAAVPITGMVHQITTTGTGDALTLANGVAGQRLVLLYVAEGAGTNTAILTPTTLAGGTTITFNALGNTANLVYSATGGWYFVGGSAVVA